MKAFSYVAYSPEGKRKTGTIVAETEIDAQSQLKTKGLFVSELVSRGAETGQSRSGGGARLNADQRAVLTRQMAVLLSADMPTETALEAVRTAGGGRAMETVATRAKASVMEGQPLSRALEDCGAGFPPYFIAALRSGEGAGDVPAVLTELADHLETVGQDKAQIANALVYPAFVAAVSLLVCGILMVKVAPEIVALFEVADQPLPELTQVMLGITGWIQANALWLGIGAVVFMAFLAIVPRVPVLKAARDRFILALPLFGKLKRQSAAVQYLRTLALVLGSRQTALTAVEGAAEVLDVAQFRHEADQVARDVRGGASMSSALKALSIVPPVAQQMITVGEQTARLARMADRSAVMVEHGLSNERKRIAALLEPILMLIVGAGVLTIVLSILLPIFDLQAVVAG